MSSGDRHIRAQSPLELLDGGNRLVIRGPLTLKGRLRLPGDKSISHRGLIFAAVADGVSSLQSLGTGDDVAATVRLLQKVGVTINFSGSDAEVVGRGFEGLIEPHGEIDCANSGTTMRIGAGLLAGRPFASILTGDASLLTRPMARVIEPLRLMGAEIRGADGDRYAPLQIRGGGLQGRVFDVEVASAQVKGCLVLAALQADSPSEIVLPGPTRDHTERLLGALGANIGVDGDRVAVSPSQPSAFKLDVPGDVSSAVFLMMAAARCPNSEVVLERVGVNPTRTAFLEALREMGVNFSVGAPRAELGEPVADITVRYSPDLTGIARGGRELGLLIDEVPALAVLGSRARGETRFADAAELRSKESDRIESVSAELRKIGATATTTDDEIRIIGGPDEPASVESHGDHRIALALAALLAGSPGESVIDGYRAVAVSYPEFASDLAQLAGIDPSGLDLRSVSSDPGGNGTARSDAE